ncbi:aldo/keto reductase [Phenylobacterium sp.]|uniref:aldo/keto reductase n=1 Tax=Phenylobacterium sp. TaxID=1871053 RepID=UPI002736DD74|nr:aldo/keto reductase [Phenylobacterium sp.]MDP3659995.1 aldo/keto reductase [Phenylobacterium sp.]
MDYVRLGNTGLKVSRLCLGCMTYGTSQWRSWVLDEAEAMPFFKLAIERGINFFDTADVYSQGVSEEVTGKALRTYAKREEVVLATKVHGEMGPGANQKGLSRKHILEAIDASLKRLGTDYVDLYQIHRFDYDTPIEETMEALNDVVRAGKARYIGASSMYAWQFAKMLSVSEKNGWAKFVSMQPQYNLVYREEEREMLPLCKAEGVGVIPWSPLARGFLAGGRAGPRQGNTERARTDAFADRLYFRDADYAVVEAVSKVAQDRGATNMQVALAWVLNNPAITSPIVGASKLGQLDEVITASDFKLTPEEVAALEAPYASKPVLDHA